jgi:hypothetical protein
MPQSTSAGASGAIFGLFGVMGTFAFKYRSEIPAALRRDIIRRIIPIILINLAFGFSVQFVDNSAHVGGLIAGVALALVVPYKRPGEGTDNRIWKVAEIVCLAIIAISFIEAFRHYDGPRPGVANLWTNPERSSDQELGKIDDALAKFVDSLNQFNRIVAKRDPSADLSPAQRAAEEGIKDLKGLRPQVPGIAHITEVLNEQRTIIERHANASPKNWQQAEAEENALVQKAKEYGLIKR